MKKILLLLTIAFYFTANAQITLEHGYPDKHIPWGAGTDLVHLTSAGYKYQSVEPKNNTIKLYNLNHSLYKTINVPTQPNPNGSFIVMYLSDELFNTNPADVEYILESTGPTGIERITIYDELGNILFFKDSINISGSIDMGPYEGPIRYTSSGVKMILSPPFDSTDYVYSLPGILPCNDCSGGIVTGLASHGGGTTTNSGIQNPYPNPTNNITHIYYKIPEGANEGEIVFYNLQGVEVKRYKVDKTFNSLLISTTDMPAGTYYYQLIANGNTSVTKKMVVIK